MYVSLFPWPDGGAGVVWLDPRGRKNTVLMQTAMDASGKLGAEKMMVSDVCSCCPTSSAVAGNGPVVMYRGHTTGDIRDMYLASFREGALQPGRAIHDDGWEIDGCPTNSGSLDAKGNEIAASGFEKR